ncbi:hypothetical protein HIM_06454 [Hirsutella minnesotensis 3608]|uniref:SAC3/GANP/THP3 conserved domain-containing protein n=1 Tax=Hirsutella minnesotensis 3608 TaxID=1043627 RepID=A0A0F7ZU45_9HYPO|nr:hypothetical protein HIM_06454 [Hirsutella minnesotensis 3608]
MSSFTGPPTPPSSGDTLARRIHGRLLKDGINPPQWPSNPGDAQSALEMTKFRELYEAYRQRVRASLTKAGLIDDPDKRKRLSDAIEFKGTCEDMCPEFEKITRITEHDVNKPEKNKAGAVRVRTMVKKLARSAAGQEAPLPMDVRSTQALRRSLNYLIDDVLCRDKNLPDVHPFLWDRTRAIRRDFAFFSSMTEDEIRTQVYVLENITRFHVTSLHLLSRREKEDDKFVEQQELEQLGKTLLSLRDVYDDCNGQGIKCDNEAEFRAYYLLFHGRDSSILEILQRQWRPSLWQGSDVIRTAIALVEALQNTQEFIGSRKDGDAAPLLAASSAQSSYFRIVEDVSVSYTMACFAECHFSYVRRTLLAMIKRALARPKNPVRDVTAASLNEFLRFDTVEEAIQFARLHNLDFTPDEQAPTDSSRQLLVLNDRNLLPHIRLSHQFSQTLVERKRGSASLPQLIHYTVFENILPESSNVIKESLFVSEDEESDREAPSDSTPAKVVTTSEAAVSTPQPTQQQRKKRSPNNLPFLIDSGIELSTSLGNHESRVSRFLTKYLIDTDDDPSDIPSAPPMPQRNNPFAAAAQGSKPSTETPAMPAPPPMPSFSTSSAFASILQERRPMPGLDGAGKGTLATGQTDKPNPFAQRLSFPGPVRDAVPTSENMKPNPFAPQPQAGSGETASARGTWPSNPNPFAQATSGSTVNGPGISQPVNPSINISNPFASIPEPEQGRSTSGQSPSTFVNVNSNPFASLSAPETNASRPPANTPAMPFSALGNGTAAASPSAFASSPPVSITAALPGPMTSHSPAVCSHTTTSNETTQQQQGQSTGQTIVAAADTPNAMTTLKSFPSLNQNQTSMVQYKEIPSTSLTTQPTTETSTKIQPSVMTGQEGTKVSSTSLLGNPQEDAVTKAGGANNAPAGSGSPVVAAKPVQPPRDLLGDVNAWYVNGDKGLVEDFMINTIRAITKKAFAQHQREVAEQKRREEEKRLEAEAERFRVYNLSLKFFYRWKRNARKKRLRVVAKRGRDEMRAFIAQRRAAERDERKAEAMALEHKVPHRLEPTSNDIVDELVNRIKSKRTSRLEARESLLASGVLSGVSREHEAAQRIVRDESQSSVYSESLSEMPSKPSKSPPKKEGAKTRALRQLLLGEPENQPQERFRRSLPSIPNGSFAADRSNRGSNASSLWKLKAMGVETPDVASAPLAMSASRSSSAQLYSRSATMWRERRISAIKAIDSELDRARRSSSRG